MLDLTAPVGKLLPGTTGNLPDDVRRVQYLMNKTSSSDGAPDFLFDTTTGVCDQALIDAITAFQTFQFAWADGRVDVGATTVSKLNDVADLTAFEAAREPDEFLSWLRRPPEWNFTLEDFLGSSSFTPGLETSAWLPSVYLDNLVDTFLSVLDPTDTAPGSWGIGAWDLYHGHVMTPINEATGQPQDPAIATMLPTFRGAIAAIDGLRASMQPKTLTDPQDLLSFFGQLLQLLAALTQPLNNLADTGEAVIFYHSFESSTLLGTGSRYAGFQPSDARRNWVTPVGHGTPSKYASADHPDNPFADFFHIVEISFLVAKDGVIGAVAETKQELVAMTQQPFATIA
jgi:hypothetical protein